MDAEAWAAVSAWAVPAALRRSTLLYAAVNASHVIGIALLFGAIATLDARLLGAFRRVPADVLGPPLIRVAGIGVALAVTTGALLFSVRPAEYAANPAFLAKLGIVVLGLANVALLRVGRSWRGVMSGAPIPSRVRIAAAASLALWIGAILAGRWIAFVA